MADKKFFSYFGLEIENHRKILRHIKETCGNDAYKNRDELFIAQKMLDEAFGEYIFEYAEYFRPRIIRAETDISSMERKPVNDWRFMKEELQYMGMLLENYNEDLDSALYMLIGSYLSKWVGIRLTMEQLPFSIVEKKMSSWCRIYQDMMLKGNRFQIMDMDADSLKGHQRLEKYSYRRGCKMHEEMREAISKERDEMRKAKKNKSSQENVQRTAHIENYILEDRMMGISFTTILYHYIKGARETEFQQVEPVIELLVQIKASIMRNRITDVVFSYMERNKYRAEIVEDVISFLQSYVERINIVYTNLLSLEWQWLYQDAIKDGEKKEVWEKYITRDFFDVSRIIHVNMSNENENGYILNNYFDNSGFIKTPYDKELQTDMETDIEMVHTSKLYRKRGGSYIPTYKGLLTIIDLHNLNHKGMSLEDIENENKRKWNEKEEVRNDKFSIKSKQVSYIRIHKTVILALKKANSGKFPIG